MFCLRVFGLCFNRIKFRVDLISWTSFKTAENGNFWAQIEKVKKSRSIFQEHCCTLSSLQLYYTVKEMFITAKRDWFDAILFQLLYIGIGRFNTTIYDLDTKTATSSMAGLFCYQGLLTWKPIFSLTNWNILTTVGSYDIVHIKDAAGHTFATRLSNIFIVGKGNKAMVTLPKGKGVRLSIAEERDRRLAQK